MAFHDILIIADIEGSSGCWTYEASRFRTDEWAAACEDMSRDIDAVVRSILDVSDRKITVKDFHRTGYNLIPEYIDGRARIVHGYKPGPVPGLGDPGSATALMMIGMHASSGSGGFLAHTLTSRISRLEVNGRLLSEAELFSCALAQYGVRPLFFSGCPVACEEAAFALKNITTCAIDKSSGKKKFNHEEWRMELARMAVLSLENEDTEPYEPGGPFQAVVQMRDGDMAAGRLSRRWGFIQRGDEIFINAGTLTGLYNELIRLCYLTPLTEKFLNLSLWMYNLMGRYGLHWIRHNRRIGQ